MNIHRKRREVAIGTEVIVVLKTDQRVIGTLLERDTTSITLRNPEGNHTLQFNAIATYEPATTTRTYRHTLASQLPLSWILSHLILIAGIVLGLHALTEVATTLTPPYNYRKDFTAIYSLIRAVADRRDPYVPLPDLIKKYIGITSSLYPYPTPHPPTLGIILLPFALLPYENAVLVWFGLQIISVVASITLLTQGLDARLSVWKLFAVSVLILAWFPFFQDLYWSNLECLMLLPLVAAWLALRYHRHISCGILLGLTILLKPILVPILLLFVLKKKWRVLGASIYTVLIGYLIAILAIGANSIVAYFREALPASNKHNQFYIWNQSYWTFPARLLELDGKPVYNLDIPYTFMIISAVIPLLIILIASVSVYRIPSLDFAFGLMICISILVSPTFWEHYIIFTLIPITQIIRWLKEHRFPKNETVVALFVLLLLLIPETYWQALAYFVAGGMPPKNLPTLPIDLTYPLYGWLPSVPLALALLILSPTISVVALGWFVGVLGLRGEKI